jgi:hypothetical protein
VSLRSVLKHNFLKKIIMCRRGIYAKIQMNLPASVLKEEVDMVEAREKLAKEKKLGGLAGDWGGLSASEHFPDSSCCSIQAAPSSHLESSTTTFPPSATMLPLSNLSNPLVTPDQLVSSGSQVDGVPRDLEDSIRYAGARLTQAAGILLRLPQDVIAQAIVLFTRFWVGSEGGSLKEFGASVSGLRMLNVY